MGSTVIQIALSDEALAIIQKDAEILKVSIAEQLASEFKWAEDLAKKTPQDIAIHHDLTTRRMKRLEWAKVREQYPWKEYIIHKDAKGARTELGWRMCPIMETGDTWYPSELEQHIGEYYLRLQKSNTGSGAIPISFIQSSEYEYYPTLKRLKKAVNRILKKYGYGEMYVTSRKQVSPTVSE
jgi:hypothetical protein